MLLSFINSNGESFPISGNYILKSWWGFGELPVDIQSSKAPYQDGRTYIDTIADSRDFGFDFTIIGATRQEVFNRRLLITSHFNPKLGPGTLEWQQDDGTIYHIDCISKLSFPSGDGQSANHQTVIVQLFAPNPFWYNPTQQEKIMVGFEGGLSFPFSFPFGLGSVGTQIDVLNTGDVDTPIMVYFYGEIVNPKIQNLTTDEEISVIRTIADGDILIINTAFGEKSAMVLSGGEYINAFEYVDPDSVFWKLAPGINTVKYTASSEGANARCRLYYYHRYSGV